MFDVFKNNIRPQQILFWISLYLLFITGCSLSEKDLAGVTTTGNTGSISGDVQAFYTKKQTLTKSLFSTTPSFSQYTVYLKNAELDLDTQQTHDIDNPFKFEHLKAAHYHLFVSLKTTSTEWTSETFGIQLEQGEQWYQKIPVYVKVLDNPQGSSSSIEKSSSSRDSLSQESSSSSPPSFSDSLDQEPSSSSAPSHPDTVPEDTLASFFNGHFSRNPT